MTPTAYYLHLGHTLQCKNKLERELLALFQSIDKTLVNAPDLPKFKVAVAMKVAEINNANPRCKAVDVTYYQFAEEHPISVQGIPCLYAYLYPITQNFKA